MYLYAGSEHDKCLHLNLSNCLHWIWN